MTTIAVVLAFLCLPVLSRAVDPIHVPLVRRAVAPRAIDPVAEAYKVKVKYGFKNDQASSFLPAGKAVIRRGTTAAVPIVNEGHDAAFLANISVGTPAQTFSVILDTGSSDLWLASNGCESCKTSAPLFQSTKSASFQSSNTSNSEVTINYEGGAVGGLVGSDKVALAGFSISSQTLLVANTVTSNTLEGSISGLMGLAFSTLAVTRATPFWQALLNENQFSSPDMGFYLAKSNPSSKVDEVPGGVFTLGGTNASLYSGDVDFQAIPVTTPSYWLQSLFAVTVGGRSIKITAGTSALAAIDTGTTLIVGPSDDVAAIWAAVPDSSPSQKSPGFFRFPCSIAVNVTLSFGGKAWSIPPEDMNIGPETPQSSFCLGAIFSVNTGGTPEGSGAPNWIIGDTFLKNVYTVFRASPPAVGFAQLSTLAGGTGKPSSASGADISTPSGQTSDARMSMEISGMIVIASILSFLIALCI